MSTKTVCVLRELLLKCLADLDPFDCKITIAKLEAILAHPPAPAIPEGWIPVSERLPEIGTEVLVYCPHKIEAGRNPVTALVRLIRHEAAAEFYWNNNYGGSNIHLQESVTHWMPFPTAPQPTEGSTQPSVIHVCALNRAKDGTCFTCGKIEGSTDE